MGALWKGFNETISVFSFKEVIVYIAVNEMLFFTFIRSSLVTKSTSNFNLLLARPRSWIGVNLGNNFGISFGNRIIYLPIIVVLFFCYGLSFDQIMLSIFKILLLLPLLTILGSMYNVFLAIAKLRWYQVEYMLYPIGQLYLTFGGVFIPLTDYSIFYRKILLYLPPADIFFQPAYFIVKGNFYNLSVSEWLVRITIHILVLSILIQGFFNSSKKFHQSYGG